MIVVLLSLDLSEVLVKLESTDSKDGLTLNPLSGRLCTPPDLCLTGRRYPTETSSRCRCLRAVLLRASDPLVLGRDVALDSLNSSIRLSLGRKPPTTLSVFLLPRLLDNELDRSDVRFGCLLRRPGASSLALAHSTAACLPTPLTAELSVLLRLLDARVGLIDVFATSSCGRETMSLGGTRGDARAATSVYESAAVGVSCKVYAVHARRAGETSAVYSTYHCLLHRARVPSID